MKDNKFCIRYKEIASYLMVGIMTMIITLIVYYGSVLTFLDPKSAIELQIANTMSWLIAVLFSYIANRKFVFESKSKHIIQEASSFFTSRIGSLSLDIALMFILVTCLHWNDKPSKLLVQTIVVITNYITSKFLVFKKRNINIQKHDLNDANDYK